MSASVDETKAPDGQPKLDDLLCYLESEVEKLNFDKMKSAVMLVFEELGYAKIICVNHAKAIGYIESLLRWNEQEKRPSALLIHVTGKKYIGSHTVAN